MQETTIALVNHQGCNRYTLICPERDRVIQFRATELNIEAIDEAKQMYEDLVADNTYYYDFVLPVYTYNILPGQLHVWQKVPRDSLALEHEKRTVIGLAKIIATASHFPHSKAHYEENGGTMSANATIKRIERNKTLKQIAPAGYAEMVTPGSKLHLLDTLPAVLTHLELAGQNIFVDKDAGNVIGAIDFDEARTEALGIKIFVLYENHFGGMENGHWTPFDMPTGEQYPGVACERGVDEGMLGFSVGKVCACEQTVSYPVSGFVGLEWIKI